MELIERCNDVSPKPEIDDAFEECLGSSFAEDHDNLQMLENERIEAMIKSIGQNSAAPNLNSRIVFYTPQEPKAASKFNIFFFKKKKNTKRTMEEILQDVLAEECFCDDFIAESWIETPQVSEVPEAPSPIVWASEQKEPSKSIYGIDKIRKLKDAICAYLDFSRFHWEFRITPQFIAKSAYVGLCIFVSIPFGMVAAEKMQILVSGTTNQDAAVWSQPQKRIEVTVEDKIIELPTVPKQEETQPAPQPQNLKIETPQIKETSGEKVYPAEEPVYANTETYEPAYAYYEPAWVEPVNEQPEIKNEVPAAAEALPEAAPQVQTAPVINEPQKIEPVEPVRVAPAEPQTQSAPAKLEPLPSSDAFMRPQASK